MSCASPIRRVEIEILPEEVKREGLDAFDRIGQEVRGTVERRPSSMLAVRVIRPEFVRKGRPVGEGTRVRIADPIELPIARGVAGPGLLADSLVRRFQDHLPLNRLEQRVRAHVLLCMLAYYVEWHMRRAWAPLLFAEGDLKGAARRRVSPVKPAARRESAEAKALTKKTAQSEPVHRFRELLAHLATRTKNTIQPEGGLPSFDHVAVPTSLQKRAFYLLEVRVPV